MSTTELKKMDEEQNEVWEHLHLIIDSVPVNLCYMDREMRFRFVNRGFEERYALPRERIIGRHVREVVGNEFFSLVRHHIETGIAGKEVNFTVEAPASSAYPGHLHITYRPHFNDKGEIKGIFSQSVDITEIRQMQMSLEESEERFRNLFEQNEDAIILLRRKSLDLIDANQVAEQLLGYTRNELKLLGHFAFITPEANDAFISAIPQGENSIFHMDRFRIIRKSGDAVIVSIWGKIIRQRKEEVIFCSIRNITDRIRLEEEARSTQARLIHANKMTSLGVLVSGIAHEINNPNTFIQGNARTLDKIWQDVMPILTRHRAATGEETLGGLPFEEIEQIVPRLLLGLKEGSRRISAIVGNLKDFAREDKSADYNAIDVNQIIRDGTMILSHLIHRHTDNFLLQLDESVPRVIGKAQQVEQVVINLIMNGLQSLPNKRAGLTVATRTDQATATVVITVRDEGEGMTEDVLARLTEPFFSTKLDKGGTGLGLSICASIIKEHSGSLRFESTPGTGTTAIVTLAMAQ